MDLSIPTPFKGRHNTGIVGFNAGSPGFCDKDNVSGMMKLRFMFQMFPMTTALMLYVTDKMLANDDDGKWYDTDFSTELKSIDWDGITFPDDSDFSTYRKILNDANTDKDFSKRNTIWDIVVETSMRMAPKLASGIQKARMGDPSGSADLLEYEQTMRAEITQNSSWVDRLGGIDNMEIAVPIFAVSGGYVNPPNLHFRAKYPIPYSQRREALAAYVPRRR